MIKVLIVDDSAFMRAAVQQILASDADTEVVGASPDGMDALEKVKTLRPDVVLLDVEMPVMDGFEALTRIMSESPTPVVMLSGLGQKNARLAIKCLERGAIDFIHKPSGTISYDIDILSDEIIEKVKTAAGVDVRKMALEPPAESYLSGRLRPAAGKAVVVIGASTGGPRAVEKVLSGMRRDMPSAIVVVQHMSAGFVPAFVERLRWACSLDVSIATSGAPVVPGKVLVASNEQIKRLNAARFQLDIMKVPGIIVARTDAEAANLLESRGDERDQARAKPPHTRLGVDVQMPADQVASDVGADQRRVGRQQQGCPRRHERPHRGVGERNRQQQQGGVDRRGEGCIRAEPAEERGQRLGRERTVGPCHVAVEHFAATQPQGHLEIPALVGHEHDEGAPGRGDLDRRVRQQCDQPDHDPGTLRRPAHRNVNSPVRARSRIRRSTG